ncbi:hypothetical protein GVAV_002679, partial [Gurleya vavrai]
MSDTNRISNKHDMASATDSYRTFNGKDKLQISQWIKEALMVADLTDLSEKDTIKLILLKLRGRAQQW